MDFKDLAARTRSIRRFKESKVLSDNFLESLVDIARLAPSGGNIQPLKFALCADKYLNKEIFETLSWAGYLTDWDGPAEGERPAGYIVVCLDKSLKRETIDHGFAVQNMVLAAAEKEVGACIIKSIKKQQLRGILQLDERYEILLVIALGYPAETVIIEQVKNDDIRYWRDKQDIFHVPKRALKDVIIKKDI